MAGHDKMLMERISKWVVYSKRWREEKVEDLDRIWMDGWMDE